MAQLAIGAAAVLGMGTLYLAKKVKDTILLKKMGFEGREIRWLKEKKYAVAMDEKGSLNSQSTVREGLLILPSGTFTKVAVKAIEKNKRTEKELTLLKRLAHVNIVKMIHFDEIVETRSGPSQLYVFMELCDCNLTRVMKDMEGKRMDVQTFRSAADQLFAGLNYIHEHKLIHGDVRPDNILVVSVNEVWVLKYSGFGLSKQIRPCVADVTQTREGMGSNGYSPAESYDPKTGLTEAADIFSLAVVLAQLISRGRHPYGLNPLDWQYHIRHGINLDLSNVCIQNPAKRDQLINLLTQMLSKNPGERPSVVDIRGNEFFRNDHRCRLRENGLQPAGFDGRDVTWLKEKTYVMACDVDGALNQQATVREGRQVLSQGRFRKVAVKVIRKTERAEKEIAILRRLKHENIVEFIDYGDIARKTYDPQQLYIIMELCDGNLTHYMECRKEKIMTMHKFSTISHQLLSGLNYIHGNGLIHRDIKPDNILVIKHSVFKYSDFGISREIGAGLAEVTQTREGIGSDGYRPPESYDRDARLSKAADIFSLAIVMAQLVSKGKHPYGPSPYDWQYHIRHGSNLDLSHVCIDVFAKRDELINLLTRMLSKNPSDRPPLVEIYEHELFRSEAREPESDQSDCIICFGKPADTVLIPCGHVHVCDGCAKIVHQCPTCRQTKRDSMKVYPL